MYMHLYKMPLLSVLILFLSACGSESKQTDTPHSNPSSFSFREVTAADLDQVQFIWAQRDLLAKEVNLVHQDYSEGSTYQINIYEHKVGGNTHYGAVIIPTTASVDTWPVTVEVDGLSQEDPSTNLERHLSWYLGKSIMVVPAFRGRILHYKNLNFFATGDFCDAYDGATDDTIALLNVVQQTTPKADMSRVMVRGYSRGGNVALLMAERDTRVTEIMAGAAPVDFYSQQIASKYGDQFRCQFFTGKTATESRSKMLASSPLYFNFLPSVKRASIFQGGADQIVSYEQANAMNEHLLIQGVNVSYYLYSGSGHSTIWQNDNFRSAWERTFNDFILSNE